MSMGKDDDMDLTEMDMAELSGGSGSAHLDGLLAFDDDDHKPHHNEPNMASTGAANNGNNAANGGKKKRYHRHTAHQIQQMEA